jgi:hypothetical protein
MTPLLFVGRRVAITNSRETIFCFLGACTILEFWNITVTYGKLGDVTKMGDVLKTPKHVGNATYLSLAHVSTLFNWLVKNWDTYR